MKIRTKKDWYKINTLFNHPKTFDLNAFLSLADKGKLPSGLYTTQNREVVQAAFYHLPLKQMCALIRRGKLPSSYKIMEAVPPLGVKSLIQGEFDGINARISFLSEPMRSALLKEQYHINRLHLRLLVGRMNYTQLLEILEMYENHIIEFSIYDKPVGVLHKNMIIWEIRYY